VGNPQFLGIRNLTSDEYIISVIIGKGCDNAKDLHCDLGADAVMLLALNGPSTLHTSSRQSQKIHATKAKYCLSTDKYVKYYPYTLKSLTETPWGHALIMTGGKHGSGGLYHIPPLICENNPDRKFITLVVKKK
jgi:hypothetical protein